MYRSSYTPAEKVVFPSQTSPDDLETTASLTFSCIINSEQVQECDTDSDASEDLSSDLNDGDTLTFLLGIMHLRMSVTSSSV